MIKYLPNTLTSLNLVCGLLSIMFVMMGDVVSASYLIFIGAFFDFTDGFAARALNAYSELGKQLDSLADLVSFGIAPSIILFYEIINAMGLSFQSNFAENLSAGQFILLLSPFLIVLASAFRLAKFNIDTKQELEFRGLPTPASGLFFASIPLVHYSDTIILGNKFINNPIFLFGFSIFISFLMVSNIPMFSLKIKNIKDKKNIPVFILLALSLFLLIMFWLKAIFAIIILYIFMSLILLLFPVKS